MESKKKDNIDNKGEGKLYEFFTPPFICKKMWELAYIHGFNPNDKVLEPSVGSGNLLVDAPNYSKIVGFEVKSSYLSMAKERINGATFYNDSFEIAFLESPRFNDKYRGKNISWIGNDFGLVMSNPPYGKATGFYSSIVKMKGQIEHWFILNSIKLLKKGGLAVFIVPSNFLRNGNTYNNIKKEIFGISELIDVYRLPNNSFKTTQIGTDIIVFKKK